MECAGSGVGAKLLDPGVSELCHPGFLLIICTRRSSDLCVQMMGLRTLETGVRTLVSVSVPLVLNAHNHLLGILPRYLCLGLG